MKLNIGLILAVLLTGFSWGCQNKANEEADDDALEALADTTERYIDAVEAASEHYKLLSEQENVRVIEMQLPAGQRDNIHSHHHETVYFLKGGKAMIYTEEDTIKAELPDGHIMHHGPWTHSVENTGDSPIRAIIFERMYESEVEPMEGYLDAAKTASEHYKVLSTDGNVRILRMTLGPGKQDKKHSHYSESAYFIKGGEVKIHAGGEVMEADIPDGHVMQHEPWTHSVENVGQTTIEAIIFEQVPGEID